MPMRLKRFYENADLHFVTFSCYHRKPYLTPSCKRDLFLDLLERVRQHYHFAVTGYVVMSEHVHLLLGKPETANLSVVLQVLKQSSSAKLSADLGSFWQRRFYNFNIRTEHKRIEKLRYLHRNPVTRGLAEKPEDWPWSSFRHYASGEPSPVKLDCSWLEGGRAFVDPTLRRNAKDGHPEFFFKTNRFRTCHRAQRK